MLLLRKYTAAWRLETVRYRWDSRVHTDWRVGGNCGRGEQKVNAADRFGSRAQSPCHSRDQSRRLWTARYTRRSDSSLANSTPLQTTSTQA